MTSLSRKVNCGNPAVTLALCPGVMGSFPPQAQGPMSEMSTEATRCIDVYPQLLTFYLWGIRFIIRTDHQPIVSVFRQQAKSSRMNRWILEMRDYRYTIEYKQGKKNVVTDQLSRPVRVIQGREGRWLGRRSKEELMELQRAEPRWNETIEYLTGGRLLRTRYPTATTSVMPGFYWRHDY